MPAAAGRRASRAATPTWLNLYNRDVIAMPDTWEYPWYAAWDLAFHMLPFARIDPHFAKEQLVLLTREWYMHPNGQLPAYEWNFGDVNPPVHAWAAWRVYKIAVDEHGHRDRVFLARTFQKLLLNFTWWVNRKDADGKNLFSGGFLGLDNIGVFDRSKPLPNRWPPRAGRRHRLDGLLLRDDDSRWRSSSRAPTPAYEDMASKFFEHFMPHRRRHERRSARRACGTNDDGFYYDEIHLADDGVKREISPLRVRSMVGSC